MKVKVKVHATPGGGLPLPVDYNDKIIKKLRRTHQPAQAEFLPSVPVDVGKTPEQLSFPFAMASESVRSVAISYADACSALERHKISGNGWQTLIEALADLGDP